MPRDLREKLNGSRGSCFKDLDLRDTKERKQSRPRSRSRDKRHRKRSPSSSSSLSLSPGPPQRVERPLGEERSRRRHRRHSLDYSPPPPRRRKSPPYSYSRRSVIEAPRRNITKPRRMSSSGSSRRREALKRGKSWNEQMNDFMEYLECSKSESPPTCLPEEEESTSPSELLPPGVESEGPEYESSPLIRFIGRKLRHLKLDEPEEGVLTYNVLSLLSRSEWIAAKTLSLLKDAGFGRSEMYEIAVTSPAQLEMDLKTAVFSGKVNLEGNPKVIQKVLRVIECLKDYFSSPKGEDDEDEESEGSDSDRMRNAMGPFLKKLNEDMKTEEEKEEKEKPNVPPGGGGVKEECPPNPWKQMSDVIQYQNLASFQDIKNSIAKDLLRLHGRQVDAFNLAQEMVSCWVVAGFGMESLRQSVLKWPSNSILPPQGIENRYSFYYQLVQRLIRHKHEFSPMISEDHLKHLVKKTLVYLMKGCNKYHFAQNKPSFKAPNNEHVNIIFNYLPPGLREAESSSSQPTLLDPYVVEEEPSGRDLKEGHAPKASEEVLSSDPLNAVLNPVQESLKPNQLPNRKYNLVTLHLEWVILKGIPQIYEISAYSSSDMSILNLYLVSPSLKKSPDTLENLGFVSNPDRHEFYYVQVGIGCVKALSAEASLNKLGSFLEEKRNCSDSENRNNGLVLLTHSEEELGNFLKFLGESGNSSLLIDVIKGFGSLETFIGRNKSKKYFYGGPKLSLSGGDEVFYDTEVRKGISGQNLVSKSKSEALYLGLQYLLDNAYPNYANFILPHCSPSFSPTTETIKRKVEKVRELYTLEVFISAHLKAQKIPLFLEGVFAPLPVRDLRDKASVIANRSVSLLVEAGYDKKTLAESFARDKDFAISSNVFLNTMNMAHRLKVMDQTMRCVHIIKDFYLQQ